MNNFFNLKKKRKRFTNITFSKSSMRIYAFIAIILILIPEWIAEFIIEFSNLNREIKLPIKEINWTYEPELMISEMNFKQLRILAVKLKINNYSRDGKDKLKEKIISTLMRNNE